MKILGHQKIWQFLKKSVQSEKISHAYLFSGQSGLGKKTLALEFTKLLNCQNSNFLEKPCRVCSTCKAIDKGIHPDLLLISPLHQKIQIGQIRDLIWYFSLRPHSAPFKVAIIEQAHLMNQEAQNSFLKTLEEPKGNTILILISEFPQMLLPTILSRVEKIKFYPVSLREIEDYLKEQGATTEQVKELSFFSSGRPGLAVDFFLNPEKLENQKQKIAKLNKIIASDLPYQFQSTKELAKEPNLKEILEIWLIYLRRILISKMNIRTRPSDSCSLFISELKFQNNKNSTLNFSFRKLQNILKSLQNIFFLTSTTSINKRLALEIFMLQFYTSSDISPYCSKHE